MVDGNWSYKDFVPASIAELERTEPQLKKRKDPLHRRKAFTRGGGGGGDGDGEPPRKDAGGGRPPGAGGGSAHAISAS